MTENYKVTVNCPNCRTSLLWMGEGIFWCDTCKKYWKQTGEINNVEYSTDRLCEQ